LGLKEVMGQSGTIIEWIDVLFGIHMLLKVCLLLKMRLTQRTVLNGDGGEVGQTPNCRGTNLERGVYNLHRPKPIGFRYGGHRM
jgi:hypothetical protein